MSQGPWQEFIRLAVSCLLVGNIFAVLVGVLMVIAPRRLAAWARLTDKWISTRSLTEPLDQTHEVDSYALRWPRTVGLVLFAGALFILIQGGVFVRRIGIADGGRLLADLFGLRAVPGLWEALWLSLVMLLVLGTLLTLAVALLMLLGKRELIRLSAVANRWISTRKGTEALDAPHYPVDSVIRQRPRLWGVVIALLASYTVIALLGLSRVL
jgi:hypothetical protein